MPYILKKENGILMEHRRTLEPHLCFLAKRIREIVRTQYCDAPNKRIAVYRYVCEELALKVQPQRRYALLSAVRAVFSDADLEWRRRMKVYPIKVEFIGFTFPLLNKDKAIEKLAKKIGEIASTSKEPHLMWPGLLNYSISILGLKIMDNQKDKEFSALIAGALEYLNSYFYEKYMAPYENEQIAKNGDVFPF